MVLSYDGTDFFGWQKQAKKGPMTVQETLEQALSRLFGEAISTVGAGRTDRGAHAVGQVVHFMAPWKETRHRDLVYRLNRSLLPPSLRVRRAFLLSKPQEASFHALKSAQQKVYKYLISCKPTLSPFQRNFSHWVDPRKLKLDVHKLHRQVQCLLGVHDFQSFQNQGTAVSTTVRRLTKARWVTTRQGFLELTLCGDGFLKQMVRNIVGAQLELQKPHTKLKSLKEVLSQKTRKQGFKTAPSSGLYLYEVKYASLLDKWGREI